LRRQDHRQAGQAGVVLLGDGAARRGEALGLGELVQAQRGGDVGQVVLEARRHHLVVPTRHLGGEAVEGVAVHAVQAHHPGPVRELFVARHQHAALAGGDGLVGVEAEHGGGGRQRADLAALVGGGQCMRGVLDHRQAVTGGDGVHGVHVGRQPGVVHRDDGLGARRDGRLDPQPGRCSAWQE
jgi:hypothetical protein